jgi:hypothetical protein
MQPNMITDIIYSAEYLKLTGFYFPESRAQAASIRTKAARAVNGLVQVNCIEKPDLEKKFGVESKKHWYTFELSASDFINLHMVSGDQLVLTDTDGMECPITLSNYREKPELERRIKSFLAVVNRFVIQGNEMARALAYWLVMNAVLEEPDFDSPVYVQLLSVVALQMNVEGLKLPEVSSFDKLAIVCERLFKNEPIKQYLTLTRIACAYGFDRELVDYLQLCNQSNERGALEVKLPLVVMHLKALLLRAGGVEQTRFYHPSDIGQMLKLGVSKVTEMDYLTAEVGEKLSTVCAIFHRVFYVREGVESLRLQEKEFSTISRKLFIASLGILTEEHLRLYKTEVE